MTDGQAQQIIVTSSVVVAGVYFYRKLTETSGAIPATSDRKSKSGVVGAGRPAPLGRFLVGFGVSYFGLSVIGAGSPELAAWLAVLLAVASILGNGLYLAADVNQKVTSTQ